MLLLIQPEYPPSVGGMQTHAAALALRLHRRGHRIAVVTYRGTEDRAATAAYDAVQPFPTYRCLSRLSYWANVRTLLRSTDILNPELVYGSTPYYGILRKLTGVPVVCRSVGNDVMRCWIPYPYTPASDLLARPAVEAKLERLYRRIHGPSWLEGAFLQERRRIVRQSAKAASTVIANSEYTRERLLEIGVPPAAIAVVVGGVDSARFGAIPATPVRGSGSERPAVLTVCRLVAKKGVDLLLQAVALARKELPHLGLLVVGDGPERSKAEEMAKRLGLGSAARFVGKVPHEQIVAFYHSADFFVLASRVHRRGNGTADVETMGRVICEANAAGVPVVATDTGGIPSLIDPGRNGLLVPPDDPDALAGAMVRVGIDATLRARLREGGLYRAASEFDWEMVVDAYEGIFERALS